jgi:hypothetical protein
MGQLAGFDFTATNPDVIGSIRLFLAAVLMTAATLKLANREPLRVFLRALIVREWLVSPAVWIIIATELLVGALLLAGPSFEAGVSTAILFLGFSVVLFLQRANPHDCGCMGSFRRRTTSQWRKQLPRTAGILAGILIASSGVETNWPTLTTIGIVASVAGAYLAFVGWTRIPRVRRDLASEGAKETTSSAVNGGNSVIAVAISGPTTHTNQHPTEALERSDAAVGVQGGIRRRAFLSFAAALPAAWVLLPRPAFAHCGDTGCPYGQECVCCVADGGPCQCFDEPAPPCPSVKCESSYCCALDAYFCDEDCDEQHNSCVNDCYCGGCACGTQPEGKDIIGCWWCNSHCILQRQVCQLDCFNDYLYCIL